MIKYPMPYQAMNKILVIEDDQDIQFVIKRTLGRDHKVTFASSLTQAREILANSQDLILLDVVLPDGDGFQFLAELKNDSNLKRTPVLMLTGRSSPSDQVMGFSLGAEDYIVKPIEPVVLQAKINSRFKLLSSSKKETKDLRVGDLCFDLPKQKVTILRDSGEKKVELTPLEFKILLHFASHEEQVFSRDQLMDAIWGNGVTILDRTIDTHISHVRKKIAPSLFTIGSVHGVGYRLVKT